MHYRNERRYEQDGLRQITSWWWFLLMCNFLLLFSSFYISISAKFLGEKLPKTLQLKSRLLSSQRWAISFGCWACSRPAASLYCAWLAHGLLLGQPWLINRDLGLLNTIATKWFLIKMFRDYSMIPKTKIQIILWVHLELWWWLL